jgi:hypothetical protein
MESKVVIFKPTQMNLCQLNFLNFDIIKNWMKKKLGFVTFNF